MSPTELPAPSAVPGLRRNMVTICAMTATIMQALDTTIANVALPYMQGSLSASQDQINWVLTSYIVAAAIMTAPVGWIANRFGRKRIFVVCSAGFTIALAELSRSSCEPTLLLTSVCLRSTSRCFRSIACCARSSIWP